MSRDFSLRQANPGLKVSVKHRMAQPGERVELLLGAQELEAYRLSDGSRLAPHHRGAPAKVPADPTEQSISLARVLGALPDPEVHARPLARYEEAIHG